MTAEQWNIMYFETIKGNSIPPVVVNFYFFSWIVIGKYKYLNYFMILFSLYVLLNLFIAMVLDGFSNKDVKKQIEEIEEAKEEEE